MTTKLDLCSADLHSEARQRGWWDGQQPLNWAQVMGGRTRGELTNPGGRWAAGLNLLQERSVNNKFRVENMMEVLRDTHSGINRPGGDFPTAGSQVSILGKQGGPLPCHWFTGSASPSK